MKKALRLLKEVNAEIAAEDFAWNIQTAIREGLAEYRDGRIQLTAKGRETIDSAQPKLAQEENAKTEATEAIAPPVESSEASLEGSDRPTEESGASDIASE